nr:hypothetical protein [Ktedonobacteraceae bacterium]
DEGALCLSLVEVQHPNQGQAQGPHYLSPRQDFHVPALLPVPQTGCCPYARTIGSRLFPKNLPL